MNAIVVLSCSLAGLGITLLLSTSTRVTRPPLVERLRPYARAAGPRRAEPLSTGSLAMVFGPMAAVVGEKLAAAVGVREPVARRLERIDAPIDATTFRLRQIGASGTALLVGAGLAAATEPPWIVTVLVVLGAPLLVFLVLEQRLSDRSERWQERIFLELPVVCEQLGMLLSAGYSVGGAVNRLAERGQGACARGLARCSGRVQHGLTDIEALREWAELAAVDELHRLVAVLALNEHASDLGRLVTDEARSIRREAHRRTIVTIERRAQQVWIPVTVAALVPGSILIAVPFLEAMSMVTGR